MPLTLPSGHDILVFRLYDLTGAFSRTAVRPDDPIQDRGHDKITFSPKDTIGIHMPHNDCLLVEISIGNCEVTKVLVDTGNSVDLIFKNTLEKMQISLSDMKPSARSLTGFNGSSEMVLGTILLRVHA